MNLSSFFLHYSLLVARKAYVRFVKKVTKLKSGDLVRINEVVPAGNYRHVQSVGIIVKEDTRKSSVSSYHVLIDGQIHIYHYDWLTKIDKEK